MIIIHWVKVELFNSNTVWFQWLNCTWVPDRKSRLSGYKQKSIILHTYVTHTYSWKMARKDINPLQSITTMVEIRFVKTYENRSSVHFLWGHNSHCENWNLSAPTTKTRCGYSHGSPAGPCQPFTEYPDKNSSQVHTHHTDQTRRRWVEDGSRGE